MPRRTCWFLIIMSLAGVLVACVKTPPERDDTPRLNYIFMSNTEGQVGYHLHSELNFNGNCPSHTWSNTLQYEGSLPPGLTFEEAPYQHVEGVPSQPGTWIVTLHVSDVRCRGSSEDFGAREVSVRFNIKGDAPASLP
jgi:hypothetical protein